MFLVSTVLTCEIWALGALIAEIVLTAGAASLLFFPRAVHLSAMLSTIPARAHRDVTLGAAGGSWKVLGVLALLVMVCLHIVLSVYMTVNL
ncbi:MAG TPA: hypothetical protein DCR55_15200 [Lentisphaeria bacterium]|jgi:hypothetical protein|nr:hypothetical protein [Lentisphaeria bacterium]